MRKWGEVIAKFTFSHPGVEKVTIRLVKLGNLYSVVRDDGDPLWSHTDRTAALAMYSWEVGKVLSC